MASLVDSLSGRSCGIVTNKPTDMTRSILDHLGWIGRFDPVFGEDAFDRTKPDPKPIQALFESWDSDPSKLVVVGDSWSDIRAGHRIGATTVGCLYGFGKTTALLEEKPDYTVESAKALKDLLVPRSDSTSDLSD
jgi:phosphoglycolate phosphatase